MAEHEAEPDAPADPTPAMPLLCPADGVPPLATSSDEIARAAANLASGTGPFAVDAERASGFRYSNRAYLIQIRRAGAGTVLIDPVNHGGSPIDNIARRLLALSPVAQYLETRPDRSRAADYALVPMPAFAESRALRHLGLPEAKKRHPAKYIDFMERKKNRS
jgi:ribonuclease D